MVFDRGGSSPPAPICSPGQQAELVELVVTVASKAIAARHVGSSPTFGIFYFVRFPGITNQNGKVSTEAPPCYAPEEQMVEAATQPKSSAQP